MSAALQRTRDRLTEAEVKADQPSPHFIELQQQMEQLKVSNNNYLVGHNMSEICC